MTTCRVRVSYVYYEPLGPPEAVARYHENVRFFLQHGQLDHPDVYTIFVLQGPNTFPDWPPAGPRLAYYLRENCGYDLGGHGSLWTDPEAPLNFPTATDAYVFLNNGPRGPFLPVHWPADQHWTAAFVGPLLRQSRPGVVSSSFFWHKLLLRPVAETWAFALSPAACEYLMVHSPVFNQHLNKHDAVRNGEDQLAFALNQADFSVGSLLYKYQGEDFGRKRTEFPFADRMLKGDVPSRPWCYEGICLHPLETVFVKPTWFSLAHRAPFQCPFETRFTEWASGEPDYARHVDPYLLPLVKGTATPYVMPSAAPETNNMAEWYRLTTEFNNENVSGPDWHDDWTVAFFSLAIVFFVLFIAALYGWWTRRSGQAATGLPPTNVAANTAV